MELIGTSAALQPRFLAYPPSLDTMSFMDKIAGYWRCFFILALAIPGWVPQTNAQIPASGIRLDFGPTNTGSSNTVNESAAAPGLRPRTIVRYALRVAIFSDPDGGSTATNCIESTLRILSAINGFQAATINSAAIRAGGLDNYEVVMFPGGSGTGQAKALRQDGCSTVEHFVARGGGYVGTCAGAFLAALGYNKETLWLEIVNARVIDVEHWKRGEGTAQVQIVNSNVILAGFSKFFDAQYFNGPLLGPGDSTTLPAYERDAVYVTDIHSNAPAKIMPGTTCMITSKYRLGKCVLFSFHPELTPGLEQLDVRAVKWAAGKL